MSCRGTLRAVLKYPLMKHLFLCALLASGMSLAAPVFAQETAARPDAPAPAPAIAKPDKALRIFLKTGGKKIYVRGYQWMTLDLNRKISLVESARRGALKMNALMTQPAERYVMEADKFFRTNPSLLQMELGQVIQGIAISIQDWETEGKGN